MANNDVENGEEVSGHTILFVFMEERRNVIYWLLLRPLLD